MAHIYKITSPTGKIYIGSSTNIKRRFEAYKSLQCKSQQKLYKSLLYHGANSHTFEIVCECSQEEMFELETMYGNYYQVLDRNKGLNLSLPKKGDKATCISEETRERFRKRQLGVSPSAETIEKIAAKLRGRKQSKERVEKRTELLRGQKRTPEQVEKFRQVQLGKKQTPEHRAKISASNTGKPRSEEYRKNIKNHRLAYWQRRGVMTPEEKKEKQRQNYLRRKAAGYYLS